MEKQIIEIQYSAQRYIRIDLQPPEVVLNLEHAESLNLERIKETK